MEASQCENEEKSFDDSEIQTIVLEFVSPIRPAQATELMNLLLQVVPSGTLPPIKMSFIAKGLSVLIVQLVSTKLEKEIYLRLDRNESMQGLILKFAEDK